MNPSQAIARGIIAAAEVAAIARTAQVPDVAQAANQPEATHETSVATVRAADEAKYVEDLPIKYVEGKWYVNGTEIRGYGDLQIVTRNVDGILVTDVLTPTDYYIYLPLVKGGSTDIIPPTPTPTPTPIPPVSKAMPAEKMFIIDAATSIPSTVAAEPLLNRGLEYLTNDAVGLGRLLGITNITVIKASDPLSPTRDYGAGVEVLLGQDAALAENAIATWAQANPGKTVVIVFKGHGGRIVVGGETQKGFCMQKNNGCDVGITGDFMVYAHLMSKLKAAGVNAAVVDPTGMVMFSGIQCEAGDLVTALTLDNINALAAMGSSGTSDGTVLVLPDGHGGTMYDDYTNHYLRLFYEARMAGKTEAEAQEAALLGAYNWARLYLGVEPQAYPAGNNGAGGGAGADFAAKVKFPNVPAARVNVAVLPESLSYLVQPGMMDPKKWAELQEDFKPKILRMEKIISGTLDSKSDPQYLSIKPTGVKLVGKAQHNKDLLAFKEMIDKFRANAFQQWKYQQKIARSMLNTIKPLQTPQEGDIIAQAEKPKPIGLSPIGPIAGKDRGPQARASNPRPFAAPRRS